MTARLENELLVDLSAIEGQVQTALRDLFGTPDAPHWPSVLAKSPHWESMVDPLSLERAAGPVGRDEKLVERGLYRKHCAQCHGIGGDGLGPAAGMLSPYPRDFRRGTFKFKSTVQGAKPTLADLARTIEHGIPGTSMPAMGNLKRSAHYDRDIPILASYVRFLAIRGEVERRIMMELCRDLDEGASLYDETLREKDPPRFAHQASKIEALLLKVASAWLDPQFSTASGADRPVLDASAPPGSQGRKSFLDAATRGRQHFVGEIAACAHCHGKNGDGQGKVVDFDEWTKDWTVRAGVDPKDPKQWKPLKKLGLLKPTLNPARNLRLGIFHGGSRPEAIYQTIVHGIEGSPMPAAARQPEVKNGMTEDQVWELVYFCQALGIPELRQAVEESDGN